jgi:dihydroxy-acid dehydratase
VIHADVADGELAQRRSAWTPPAAKATKGVLAKYVRVVKSASEGCVTDET